MNPAIPIPTLHLFPILDEALVSMLKSLSVPQWETRTIASKWTVKDVAAHLLDGNLRGLSISRDGYFGDKTGPIDSQEALVAMINRQNHLWTDAARRLSPSLLMELLEITGPLYTAHLQTLDPQAPAVFSVAWAGQEQSPNWFHIAREYTEKFLHQQQIRDAVGIPGIMTRELFYPFIDTLMHALPHTFREVNAPNQTTVTLVVSSPIGGTWSVVKNGPHWVLLPGQPENTDARVVIDPDLAWKLFSKSLRPADVMEQARIEGDQALGMQALQMVSVMA